MAQKIVDPRPYSTEELNEATPDAVTFDENGVFRDVTHEAGGSEAGFSYSMVDVGAFTDLLDRFNLPDSPTRFDKFLDDMDGARLLWTNSEVMLVTGANPITGEKVRHATSDEPKKGWLSAVGIYGDSETVDSLFHALDAIIHESKGKDGNWGYL
jgi:hypothetical protein